MDTATDQIRSVIAAIANLTGVIVEEISPQLPPSSRSKLDEGVAILVATLERMQEA
jgi:methyl-accepting chemotaxis protein